MEKIDIHSFIIANINKDYLEYLYKFDNKVPQEHTNSKKRPFVGVVFNIKEILYFVPLTSPKPKFEKLNNKIDFYKLKNGELGAINFNNMIPVNSELVDVYDFDNENDQKYKRLLQQQQFYLLRRQNEIRKKAYRLYDKFMNDKLDKSTKSRCCDFKLLETKLVDYINADIK